MAKKRDRLEIIYQILKIVQDHNNSIKPTPLLRYANISSQSFSEYYKELIEKGFIREEHEKSGRVYITLTDKGFRYLGKYQYLLGIIDEFEL